MLQLNVAFQFLQRDAMHKRGLCRHVVSVCLSRSCVKTNKHIIKMFLRSGRPIIPEATRPHVVIIVFFSLVMILLFFCAKRHSNTPTQTPLTGASNAGGVGKNCNSEPISGFSACC